MHPRRRGSPLLGLATGLIVALLSSASANAQAWLPPKGEAWLSLGYGNLNAAALWPPAAQAHAGRAADPRAGSAPGPPAAAE